MNSKIKFLSIVCVALFASFFSMTTVESISNDFTLSSLIEKSYANPESVDKYPDRFERETEDTIEAWVEFGSSRLITKALGVKFEGGTKLTRTFKYTCCNSGGGRCSKDHPKCENVNLLRMLIGMR